MAEMGILERRIKSTRAVSHPIQRAVINIQVAFAHFEEDFEHVVGVEGVSSSSFNLLRILRGAPDGHPRGEIASRLVYRRADVTRLIDGLVRRGLAERVRSKRDRRLSLTRLTRKGLALIDRLDAPLDRLLKLYEKKLSAREWLELSRLLEAVYEDHVD